MERKPEMFQAPHNGSTNQFSYPIRIQQYPTALETKLELQPILPGLVRQSSWSPEVTLEYNSPAVNKPGTSGSHESDPSRETGVHCLEPERCIFQPPIGRDESTHLCF